METAFWDAGKEVFIPASIMSVAGKSYDLFISHVVEDKIPFVNEICFLLKEGGASVSCAGRELHSGEDIPAHFEAGFQHADVGIVVVSQSYLSRVKTFATVKEPSFAAKGQLLIPVVMGTTVDELRARNFPFGSTGLLSGELGVQYVVNSVLLLLDARRQRENLSKTSMQKRGWRAICRWLGLE